MNKSFRWKMILYFIASIFLAVAGVILLLLVALFLASNIGFFEGVLNIFSMTFGRNTCHDHDRMYSIYIFLFYFK